MNAGPSFWESRLDRFGHTGWSDKEIYAYDQKERLKLVEESIARISPEPGDALDFGCGTGDFSRILLSHGFTVCGYDPFVEPKISSSGFRHAKSYDDLQLKPGSVDLCISITVLDHIIDQSRIIEALSIIRRCLSQHGVLLMLEYALDDASDRERHHLKNNYQSFRTLDEWTTLLERTGFQIASAQPFPHPLMSPSQGFAAYARSLPLRVRRKLGFIRSLQGVLDAWMDWIAQRQVRRSPSWMVATSPLKLMICHPSNSIKTESAIHA